MTFALSESIEVLERTPGTLASFVSGLSDGWLACREGEGTWNVQEVIDHLIEGERHNWMPRLEMMLQDGEPQLFPPFDRFAHLDKQEAAGIQQSLDTFSILRAQNVARLKACITTDELLARKGKHPAFGTVTIKQLLATWVVHDLTHMAQITRVMAKRYQEDVGPWREYLGILQERQGWSAD
ncbi:DinB family protein [Xylanibacillus composti]|uniref:DinB-like domain-containing protein n=1 Tax=Xylanibacillus composti TaxID=1572762 RepID=A0A8J4H4B6_9BACL|nr:DinB family protein [Xylanibacillus composti]MDT9726145.1 DinB family protein [Xylanibacillus composti]GIQ70619.1 hypothetical protein XYCOK13_34430 [Xylanibacillus composti]